jgi:nitrogen fixation/metabolism regulation signal transduction histidine kinase
MRKIYYLKPDIQNAFTNFFAVLTAVEIILFGVLIYVVDHLNINRPNDMLYYIRYTILFLIVLLFSVINFWIGLRLSHRIGGPIVNIQRILEQAQRGDYKARITLRSKDFLHEIADSVNLLLEKLETQQKQLKENKSEIQ